ncbi:MAG: hypothetical protein ABIT96_00155 [Ferruginibacter sp.]
MHSANLTTAHIKTLLFSFIFIYSFQSGKAQENSPYSRYAMGDQVPAQNITSRGMGGIAAALAESRSLNLTNPAALGHIYYTVFDFGGEIDIRNLRSNISPDKYTSVNTLVSYLQIGFPIASQKMKLKGNNIGLSFGLKPLTRISYKINEDKRVTNIDSVNTLYEGSGGINQANISLGVKLKKLSLGFTTGYSFGNKDYSTKLNFVNDSVIYYRSNSETQTRFGSVFLNLGMQYADTTSKKGIISFGVYGNLAQNMRARREKLDATFIYDGNGSLVYIDTVNYKLDQAGRIKIPATIGAGFTYADSNYHWLVGADIEYSNWGKYSYYGQPDNTQNSWRIKLGAQYYPASSNTPSKKYWSFVTYRGGLYYGSDYVTLNDKKRPEYGLTAGASFPLTSFQQLRYGNYVLLHTGLEVGRRGNKESASVRENIARFSIGLSMNAAWFQNRKYD